MSQTLNVMGTILFLNIKERKMAFLKAWREETKALSSVIF